MNIYAIIPARSGSKGLPDKNIREMNGHPLISYSIAFARQLGCQRVICSTDSPLYADIARAYGAEVPFLRSAFAAADTAMEEDILNDLAVQFKESGIEQPDILVWLRPTFVFRDLDAVKKCIEALIQNPEYTAARTVCESESRLYSVEESLLKPDFNDQGKSMIRRQSIGARYKVFSTDIIRFKPDDIHDDFLGRHVFAEPVNKFCGLDIDDKDDFIIIETVAKAMPHLTAAYTPKRIK